MEKLTASPEIRNKARMYTVIILIHRHLEDLNTATKQEKDIKMIEIGNEEFGCHYGGDGVVFGVRPCQYTH